jgi:hypothetical protein
MHGVWMFQIKTVPYILYELSTEQTFELKNYQFMFGLQWNAMTH